MSVRSDTQNELIIFKRRGGVLNQLDSRDALCSFFIDCKITGAGGRPWGWKREQCRFTCMLKEKKFVRQLTEEEEGGGEGMMRKEEEEGGGGKGMMRKEEEEG